MNLFKAFLPAAKSDPLVTLQSEEELEKLKKARASQIKLVWLFFILLVVFNNFVLLRDSANWLALNILSVLGLLVMLFFRHIAIPNRFYNNLAQSIESFLYAGVTLSIVTVSGTFDSPFFFALYLIPFLANVDIWYASPMIVAFLETAILQAESFLIPEMGSLLYANPLRFAFLTISPVLMGYFITLTAKRVAIQRSERDKIAQYARLLSEEKVRFEEILQSIQDGVITTDLEGYVTLVSRKALEILGSSQAAIKNKHISQIIPFDTTKEQKSSSFEVELKSLDIEPIKVSINTFPLRSENGEIKGTIYVLRDITKTEEFETMKLDFVAMAAHELRTPLTAARGYISLLLESIGRKINPEEELFLKRTKVSLDQLGSLIENLLNVSRIERGLLKLEVSRFPAEKVAANVVNNLSELARQKNIRLIFERPPTPLPLLLGDEYLIGEALTNLIKNGIEFNHPGGWVMVRFQPQPNKLIIHVTDNGKGIPVSALPYLFTKFFRVSTQLVQGSKGTGLGLYITKSIIDAHKGKIWVNSIEGKGSNFSFSLPITQPLQATPAASSANPASGAGPADGVGGPSPVRS